MVELLARLGRGGVTHDEGVRSVDLLVGVIHDVHVRWADGHGHPGHAEVAERLLRLHPS